MLVDRIHILIIPLENLTTALTPFHRLGMAQGSVIPHAGMGTQAALFAVGDEASAVQVELLSLTDYGEASHARTTAFADAAQERAGALALLLRAPDLARALTVLRERGLDPAVTDVFMSPNGPQQVGQGMPPAANGPLVSTIAELRPPPAAAMDVWLSQTSSTSSQRFALWQRRGFFASTLPLKRLDHVAAVTQDLEASTRFWTDVLEVPLFGEVRTPTTIIRQFKLGDAMLELLGPASPDSPLAQRRPGLLSMAAFEVTDIAAAVAEARAAGFTVTDPAPGSLPGTRVTRIPGEQLSGFTLQLLEYV